MKIKSILITAAAVTLMAASPALANSEWIALPSNAPPTVGPDIVVNTDADGSIHKSDYMAFESQKFNELAVNNGGNYIRTPRGHTVTKDQYMAWQSAKFDQMDSRHDGVISKDAFQASEASSQEPAAGPTKVSTSMPPAFNQVTPNRHVEGGADGAGGWTAQ